MKLNHYLRDKGYAIILFFFSYCLIFLILSAFKINKEIIVAISLVFVLCFLLLLFIDYFRKKTFYEKLLIHIEKLDKSYLVLEMLEKPNFYEGELLYQALYEINKSMCENVKKYERQTNDFKEYIEMWIHEVKIPISSLILMAHNNKDKIDKKVLEQISRIENDVEQVLYYARSENAEKDYLIKETSLSKVIASVALKNKNDLLEQKIDLIVENENSMVYTDSKWLEFILNQIISNSIKYKKEKNSYIKITIKEEKEKTKLIILDNGIGIPASDIPKVFDKSFTGYNGRIRTKSTGMGLFIVKNLCDKLGHKIEISSQINEYTKIEIIFYKNNYYDVIKMQYKT